MSSSENSELLKTVYNPCKLQVEISKGGSFLARTQEAVLGDTSVFGSEDRCAATARTVCGFYP